MWGAAHLLEYAPDHPRANRGCSIGQHVLVAECHLGELILDSDLVVHHRNQQKWDNRWSNLQVVTKVEHALIHESLGEWSRAIPLTERQVHAALHGRTTAEAAELLGVDHQTLRNRFDHLLTKRKSPFANYPAAVVAKVKDLAEDPKISTRDAMAILGLSALTIRRVCQENSIAWIAASNRSRSQRPYGQVQP